MLYIVEDYDTYQAAAWKIFYHYSVGQSTTIKGVTILPDDTVEAKGDMVCKELQRLDHAENFVNAGTTKGNGMRRKRTRPENTIGDLIRNKTFRFEKRIINGQIRVTIWRLQ